MAQGGPLLLRDQRLAQIERLWQAPVVRAATAWRAVPYDLLQPPPNHLGKAHFVFRRQPFGLAEDRVGNLHLKNPESLDVKDFNLVAEGGFEPPTKGL